MAPKKKYSINQIMTDWGAEMRRLRRDKNVSQRALSADSGVTQQTIINVEKMSCPPNAETILKILEPLGKTLQIVDLPK